MPFVQRNHRGEVTGLFANRQLGYAEEQLADDHPDVVAFRKAHPTPKELLEPLSVEDIRRLDADSKRIATEHDAIRQAIAAFHQGFSMLENALSALLYIMINQPKSQIAYAIYYSPTGFEARSDVVENALIQVATENAPLADLRPLWKEISDGLRRSRILRNAIAHGSPVTMNIRGTSHARYSPPAFDVIRVGRVIAKRQVPGLTANDITQGNRRLRRLRDCVDQVNRLIHAFYDGDPSLPRKYDSLRVSLTKFHSP